MVNLLVYYYSMMKEQIRKHEKLLRTLSLLLITLIAGIYLNLFTNTESMKDFWGIDLNTLGDIWFMLAFGLIAGIALFKSVVAVGIIGVISLFSTFIMYLTYTGYSFIIKLFNWSSNLLILFILTIIEFGIALLLWGLFPSDNPIDQLSLIKSLISLLILLLGLVNLKFFITEIDKRKMERKSEINLSKKDKKKIVFGVKIVIFTLLLSWLAWTLAKKVSLNPSEDYIDLIITTAVFLAGFGLLGIGKKDSVFFVNVKQIITWSLLSIISAFCYLAFKDSEILSKMFFALSVGLLFFTMVLVFLLVWYHDNEHMKDLESSKKSST